MLYAVFLRRQLTDYRTRDKPAVVPAQPDLQPFPSDFLGTLAAQSLFTDFDPNILGLLNNNQEVVQLASGTDVDPFHTEGLFSTDWLDDILGNQSTMQQPVSVALAMKLNDSSTRLPSKIYGSYLVIPMYSVKFKIMHRLFCYSKAGLMIATGSKAGTSRPVTASNPGFQCQGDKSTHLC